MFATFNLHHRGSNVGTPKGDGRNVSPGEDPIRTRRIFGEIKREWRVRDFASDEIGHCTV